LTQDFECQARLPHNVAVEVADEMIRFTSDGNPLGEWAQARVEVEVRPDGFHLMIDDEEIVLTVTDPSGFARALGVGVGRPRKAAAEVVANPGAVAVLGEGNGATKSNGLSSRLESITPGEGRGCHERVSELKAALTDDAIPPQDVFGRWLRLLKEVNQCHGQGAMPTPLFLRLNTELLELIPAPTRMPGPEPVAQGVSA
jgi:hypothetical protein